MTVQRIGLDPEIAIVSKRTGKGRSAHMFIGDENRQFTFQNEEEYWDEDAQEEIQGSTDEIVGSEISRDGAVLEVRTLAPTACRDNLVPYLGEALRRTHVELDEWRKGHFKMSSAAKIVLDSKSLENAPADIAEFGCAPDFDAYNMQVKSPTCPTGDLRRWTGGHIHASKLFSDYYSPHAPKEDGDEDNTIKEAAAAAIIFDYAVALPFVAMLGDEVAEDERERRQLYGQPGSFRWDREQNKIEFRTLSGELLRSPLLLGWAIGMVKSFVGSISGDFPDYVKRHLMPTVSLTAVYDAIRHHDVAAARDMYPRIFPALPKYEVEPGIFENRLSGGGFGTMNPYFYEKFVDVMVAANKEGTFFKDDMKHNWGLYPDFEIVHHRYWGVQSALAGELDEEIFPMREQAKRILPNTFVAPRYTHPINGGKSEWVLEGAGAWLL